MPLDTLADYDWIFYKKAEWEYVFSWLPHKCEISNKLLWFTRAYRGMAVYTGPGEPVIEYKWFDKDQFMIARLKGLI